MQKTTIKDFEDRSNIEIIEELMKINNGYITSKILTSFGIHRGYLKIMCDKGLIEKVAPGIYVDKRIIEDKFYTFHLHYPKTIFSGFTALYFYNLTEVYPSKYEITVPQNYHVDYISKHHIVRKCKNDNYEMGLTKIKTPMGYEVNAYDRERCICDIIRFRKHLDFEQVKKSVKMYIKDKEINIFKLRQYAKKLNVYDDVINFVGMYYE